MQIVGEEVGNPQKLVVARLLGRGKSANGPRRQQDSAYSWLVCVSGLLASVTIIGVLYSYGILFPVLLKQFQQGRAKTGEPKIKKKRQN